ncbi:hypothetical protein COR50_08300 [Chitinophaga caeni]|uniref:Uncharacterized protein n=1 Tax=Chitinophaga caeni TaxID=2029983 RepID=A0A291QTL2_9BACT|nr:hypothetical protein [Chitinophaga caeni]ATL47184.1 hypothetical protein COR50_08300 [Chitinophaga caeni]
MKQSLYLSLIAVICIGIFSFANPTKSKHAPLQKEGNTVRVDVTQDGIQQLVQNGYALIKETGPAMYMTIPIGDTGPVDPDPGEPIICDGMTLSQLWADIDAQWNAWRTSPAGIAAQQHANKTCQPVGICISNCGLAVAFVLEPSPRWCATFELAEYLERNRFFEGTLLP